MTTVSNLWDIVKDGRSLIGDPIKGTKEQVEAYKNIVYDVDAEVEPYKVFDLNNLDFVRDGELINCIDDGHLMMTIKIVGTRAEITTPTDDVPYCVCISYFEKFPNFKNAMIHETSI